SGNCAVVLTSPGRLEQEVLDDEGVDPGCLLQFENFHVFVRLVSERPVSGAADDHRQGEPGNPDAAVGQGGRAGRADGLQHYLADRLDGGGGQRRVGGTGDRLAVEGDLQVALDAGVAPDDRV